MRCIIVVVLVGWLAGHAEAQAPLPPPDARSENVALGLSLGGTVVSWVALIGASSLCTSGHGGCGTAAVALANFGFLGTFLAPSFGHWYARKALTRGLAVRGVGIGVGLLGLVAAAGCIGEHADCNEALAGAGLLAGIILYGAGTFDDIATAPGRARDYNRRHSLMIAPAISAQGGGVLVGGWF